ncbi:MAG: ARMT1-like domain-containing protein [Thermodesulfobacteriota bacterium]
MRTTLDCLPCFLRQAVFAAGLGNLDAGQRHALVCAVAELLPRLDMELSPPENAVAVYRLIATHLGVDDPFLQLKQQSTAGAMAMLPGLRQAVTASADPLLASLRFAIAGNIIDYGANHAFDAQQALDTCLAAPLAIDDYRDLATDLAGARTVLYLADNCGEIVLDGLFLERLAGKEVTVAVKESPIINDATLADARASGLDRFAALISNGTGVPGTPLPRCSDSFRRLFAGADLVISKGQGNFETLSEESRPIYFLLTVKCPVVARHVSEKTGMRIVNGDLLLMRNRFRA